MAALGMEYGAFHSEFIRGDDGELCFLETAARVGGASIDMLVEHASGLNLWAEWAHLEAAKARRAKSTSCHRKAAASLPACSSAWRAKNGPI